MAHSAIPALIQFKGGQPVHTVMGNQSKASLEREILPYL